MENAFNETTFTVIIEVEVYENNVSDLSNRSFLILKSIGIANGALRKLKQFDTQTEDRNLQEQHLGSW